ncbi:hypothetical protein ACFX13_000778 [Malus domestica]
MLKQVITLSFKASNNEIEYEVLLAGLRMAKDWAVKKLTIHSYSHLITSHTTRKYMAKHLKMVQYLEKVQLTHSLKFRRQTTHLEWIQPPNPRNEASLVCYADASYLSDPHKAYPKWLCLYR